MVNHRQREKRLSASQRIFRRNRAAACRTGIVSVALLILMGILMTTGTVAGWRGMPACAAAEEPAEEMTEDTEIAEPDPEAAEKAVPLAPDFTLTDQYGEEHTLSEYRGKTVFLNFWATWCPWCVKEMPDIEALYHELGENQGKIVILGIAGPGSVDTADEPGVAAFLTEQGLTYPTLMDPTGEQFSVYGASALPTSWLIGADGLPIGYVPGALTRENILELLSTYAPEAMK